MLSFIATFEKSRRQIDKQTGKQICSVPVFKATTKQLSWYSSAELTTIDPASIRPSVEYKGSLQYEMLFNKINGALNVLKGTVWKVS